MEFYDFPFSWECHHPNSIIFQRRKTTTSGRSHRRNRWCGVVRNRVQLVREHNSKNCRYIGVAINGDNSQNWMLKKWNIWFSPISGNLHIYYGYLWFINQFCLLGGHHLFSETHPCAGCNGPAAVWSLLAAMPSNGPSPCSCSPTLGWVVKKAARWMAR